MTSAKGWVHCGSVGKLSYVSRRFDLLIWAFLPALLMNAAFVMQPWWNPRLIFVDPLIAPVVAKTCCGVYFGMASNIGVLYWAVAASCCGLAGFALQRRPEPRATTSLLIAAALFTALLCVDDLFMLHEEILPKLGVPQPLILIGYAVLGAAYVYRSLPEIRRHDPLVFAMSIGFLATSVGVDFFNHSDVPFLLLAEDVTKLMGIAGWSTWHVRYAVLALTGEGAAAKPLASRQVSS
jgi:hypothetical protein